jgi:hypothetical protein
MRNDERTTSGRIRRLAEELAEEGFPFDGDDVESSPDGGTAESRWPLLLTELDYALRPKVHERRVPSYGSIVDPTADPSAWPGPTDLRVTRRPLDDLPTSNARWFADGLSSWLLRRGAGPDELIVFDRAAGSERDLVVLAEATGGTIVQRHPAGWVRLVGAFGVLRWDGVSWHHEPPISIWINPTVKRDRHGNRETRAQLLEFAVHDLGARGIGALLVYRSTDGPMPSYEDRLPTPPPLRIDRPADLAPLRHVLAQIDGAAVFDASGTLQLLGVRLVPSALAESDVEGFGGMRHTAGRRYSFDDPAATVIVVSEDGPVTVLRNGELLGRSNPGPEAVDESRPP